MPKPDHVTVKVGPSPPLAPFMGELTTQDELRTAVRDLTHYQQRQTVWLQQTLGTLQKTLSSFAGAINYILDQLP